MARAARFHRARWRTSPRKYWFRHAASRGLRNHTIRQRRRTLECSTTVDGRPRRQQGWLAAEKDRAAKAEERADRAEDRAHRAEQRLIDELARLASALSQTEDAGNLLSLARMEAAD